ncbi:hypothetical protein ABPG72_012795 [Tetrahymena utriculariae]
MLKSPNQANNLLSTYAGRVKKYFETQNKKGNFEQGFKNQTQNKFISVDGDAVACTCECHGQKQSQLKRKIVLNKGGTNSFNSFRGKFKSSQQNLIYTSRSSKINLFFKVLNETILSKPIYIYTLIALIFFAYRSSVSPFTYQVFLIPLLFYIALAIFKEYYINYHKFILDRDILRGYQVKVLNKLSQAKQQIQNQKSKSNNAQQTQNENEKEINHIKCCQLEPSDILLIKKDEFVPADVLILDSSERYFDVNSQKINGQSSLQPKQALRVTFEDPNSQVKGKFEEYKKQLNCTVEYNYESNVAEEMEGTLRLKVEPTGEKFTIQNILLNGTYLHRVDWVFGLVLKCGKESHIYDNTNYNSRKKNFFERIISKFSYFLIAVLIMLSLLSRLLYTERRANDSQLSDIQAYLSQNYWHNDKSILIDSRTFYIIYSICLPLSIFALLDFLLIYQKIQLEYNSQKQSIVVNNPDALPNLSVVNWAFFDKTGTIANNRLKIESIIVENELYFLDKQSQFYKQMLDIEGEQDMLIDDQEIQIAGLGIQPAGQSVLNPKTKENVEQDDQFKYQESGNQLTETLKMNQNSNYNNTKILDNKQNLIQSNNPFVAKVAIQTSIMMSNNNGNIESSLFGMKNGIDSNKLKLQKNGSYRVNTLGEVQSPFGKSTSNSQEQRKRIESVFVKAAPSRFATTNSNNNNNNTNIHTVQGIISNEATSLNDLHKIDSNKPNTFSPIIETSIQKNEHSNDSIPQKNGSENRLQFSPEFNQTKKQNQNQNQQQDQEQDRKYSFALDYQQQQNQNYEKNGNLQQQNQQNEQDQQGNDNFHREENGVQMSTNRSLKVKSEERIIDSIKSNNTNNDINKNNSHLKNQSDDQGMICNFLGLQDDENQEKNEHYKGDYITYQNKDKDVNNIGLLFSVGSSQKVKLPKKHNTIIQEVEVKYEGEDEENDDKRDQMAQNVNRDLSPKSSILVGKQKSSSSANITNSNLLSSPKFKSNKSQSFNNLHDTNGGQNKMNYTVINTEGQTGMFGQDSSIQEQDEIKEDYSVNITEEENNLQLPSENQEVNQVSMWNYGNQKQNRKINFTIYDIQSPSVYHINPLAVPQPTGNSFIQQNYEKKFSIQNLEVVSPLPNFHVKKVTSNLYDQQESFANILNPSDKRIQGFDFQNKQPSAQELNPQSIQKSPSLKIESKDMIASQTSQKGLKSFKKRMLSRGASLDINSAAIVSKRGVHFAGVNVEDNTSSTSPLQRSNPLKQIHEVSKQFQYLKHSRSNNANDNILKTNYSPTEFQKNKMNLLNELGHLSPVSFKRANHLQRLTRMNQQILSHQNAPTNAITNTTTSNIKQSQISEISIQKITYHEGEEEFINRLSDYKDSTQDFVKALIVCQGWKIKVGKDGRHKKMEGKKREDEYIFKYIENLGIKCKLQMKRNQFYIISNTKNPTAPSNKVVIRKSIDFYKERNRSSFLVEESQIPNETEKISSKIISSPVSYHLYVRGGTSILDLCKDMNEMFKERLRFCIAKQFDLGCRAIIYGKKQVTRKQAEEIESNIKTIKSQVEEFEGFYEKLLSEMESEIHFLGCIFIQDQINEGFQENLQFLNDSLVKVGILSGDTQEKVKSVANLTQFASPEFGLPQKIFEIEGINHDEISISIKKSLASLKDLISSNEQSNNKMLLIENREPDYHNVHDGNNIEKNLEQNQQLQSIQFTQDRKVFQNVLIVGQKQLDLISTNQTLEAHFAFILAHVGKVIAYELRAEHKQYFVRLVKFIDPKNVVMSVGDGWNDALMMQISDISFELRQGDLTNQKAEHALSSDLKSIQTQKSQVNSSKSSKKQLTKKSQTYGNHILNNKEIIFPFKTSQFSQDEDKKKTITSFSFPNAGDLIIQDLHLICNLMKSYSPKLFRQLQYIIFKSFYFSFLLFLFNLSSNWEFFSGNLQLKNSDIVFLQIILFIPRIVIYILLYDPIKSNTQLFEQFDKLYHNNRVQRQQLRVSSLFTNSLIESIIHFLLMFLTCVFSDINDSYDNLRLSIVLQVIIVTHFTMFYSQELNVRFPNIVITYNIIYEVIASYLYLGVYLEYSSFTRNDLGEVFRNGQQIMCLIFNITTCILFSYLYSEFRVTFNDQLLNKFFNQVESMSQQIKSIFENVRKKQESHILGDQSNKQSNSMNRVNSYHQLLFDREWQQYIEIIAQLEHFLENQLTLIKKPFQLIKKIFKNVKIDKHIEQILNPAELSMSIGQGFSKTSLQFIDQGLQKNYDAQHSKSTLNNLRFNMGLITMPSLIICILSYSLNEPLRGEESYSENVATFRLFSLIICIIYIILSFALLREKFLVVMNQIMFLFIAFSLIFQIIYEWYKRIDFIALSPFISYFISLIPYKFIPSVFFSSFNLAQQYVWFAVQINQKITQDQQQYLKDGQSTLFSVYLYICYFALIITILGVSLQNKYIEETDQKNQFLLKIQFQEEKSQRQDILGILLPEFIREDVILGKTNFSRDQEEASILFCDISDFDKIMDIEDYKIVSLLDNLFREFDELTFQYGLQKIETVGKTYMAAGGLKAVEKNLSKKIAKSHHFIRMLIMSNKMHQVAAKSQWGEGYPIKLKIGVHIGPITAGVIGYHKPQFSLIGDTVNTTSRLCSNCEPGRSLFSDIIFEKISPFLENNATDIDWAYEEFQFEAKGKGLLKSYYIAEFIENDFQKSQNIEYTSIDYDKQQQKVGQVVQTKRQKDRYKTKIFDLKPHFTDNEFDNAVDESQDLRSPGSDQNSGEIPKSLNFKKSIIGGDLFFEKKKNSKSQGNKIVSDEFKSQDSLHNEQNSKSVHKYPSNNNSYIQPASNNISLLNMQPQKNYELNGQNETSNMLSPSILNKREKSDKINGILNLKKGKQNSVQNSLILENGGEDQRKHPSNVSIPLNNTGIKVQVNEQKSVHSLQMADQQNPQEDDRSAIVAASTFKVNQDNENRRVSKLRIIDPKGILKRQNSKVKEDLMEKSIMSDIGKNIQNIDQEESQSTSVTDENEIEVLKYNWFLLASNHDQNHLYKNFESQQFQKHSFVFNFQLVIMLLLNFLMMTFRILILQNGLNWIFYSIDIISIVMAIIPVLSWEKLWKTHQLRSITLWIYLLSIISILGEFYYSYNGIFKIFDMLHIQIIAIMAIVNKCIRFTDAIAFSFCLIVAFQIIDIFKGAYCMSDIIIITLPIIGFLSQKRQSTKRCLEFFNKNRSNDHQKHQEVRLLVHLLPSHIFDRFLRNPEDKNIFTEKFTMTTLLFADISGFTAYSSNKKPEQVVHMLKSLFTKFDHKCIKHNVFKLYTIGDCYIVMGFSDANKRDPPAEAKNVLEMGFSMIESLRQFRQEQKDPSDQNADIHMRIGIHIGDIIGGVIGKNVVRYDIYGKDVLLANKMESNGEKGRILISDPLKQVIQEHFPDKFEFKSGPEVQVKSINIKMKSYFVDQTQKQD